MHQVEQYQKKQMSTNDLWTSYDMQYNTTQYKMSKSFANKDSGLLDIDATEMVPPQDREEDVIEVEGQLKEKFDDTFFTTYKKEKKRDSKSRQK